MIDIIKDAINLTRQLVSIPSESSEPVAKRDRSPEEGVVALLAEICTAYGISWRLQEVSPGRHNLITLFPKPGAPKILFLVHMDTVSGLGMSNPFGGELKDNKIWGRGSCDTKGSLATIFSVLVGLKKQCIPLKYDVTVVGTVDEECRMAGSAKFALENSDGWDLCVAMEPSRLLPISSHIGVYRCRIVFDSSTESYGMDNEVNVKNLMDAVKNDLKVFEKKICRKKDPKLGRAVMTITEFKGGGCRGKIKDPTRFLVDIRILPEQSPAGINAEIIEIVGDRGRVVPLFTALGIDSEPEQFMIKEFQESIAKNGICSDLTAVRFPSDCSQLRSKCASLVWGPGNWEQAHGKDEFIEVSQIELGCKILGDFLSAPVSI